MFRRGSFTLFRVKGVPICLHWSLFLILPYIAIVFSAYFFDVANVASVASERVLIPPLAWGTLMAIALFASVALHELAHTLVALRAGARVRAITLMLLGGVSEVERLPDRRGVEATMAAAGPAASLVLAGLLFAVQGLLPGDSSDLRLGVFYLARINLVLGVFNLLPAFPMDGGRVLRGLLAGRLGNLRATRLAAGVGQVLAAAMAAFGIWTGSWLLLLIAVFIYVGAGQEARGAELHAALAALRLSDVAVPHPAAVVLAAPLAELPARMRDAGRDALVVTDELHQPLAVVRAADLARFSPTERSLLRVRDLRDRIGDASVMVPWNQSAADALDRADDAGVDFVIAIDPASEPPSLVGLLDRHDLSRALMLQGLDAGRGLGSHDRPL
jgi:Zn-dependent protease/CBS domain-containing protein